MIGTAENTYDAVTGAGSAESPEATAVRCPICGSVRTGELLEAPDRFHLHTQMYRLACCSECATVWLPNPPAPEAIGAHYTEDYHRAIVAAGEGAAASRWKDQVKLIRQYKTGGALLDIGCSSGGFLSNMKSGAWQLCGIEMEASTAARARATTGAEVFVGDAVEAPFPAASFDVITCFDVLEHVYNPREFLTKVLHWLKPGGIFYAMMPNIASWEARAFGDHWFGLELPRHLFHFSPKSLRCLMGDIGFSEVLVKTPAISYIERSSGYVCATTLSRLGFSVTPQAKRRQASLPWKVVRKGLRLGVIAPLAQIASLAGCGPCMEVVFSNGSDQ